MKELLEPPRMGPAPIELARSDADGLFLRQRRDPRSRWRLHAALFLVTALTLTASGSLNEGALELIPPEVGWLAAIPWLAAHPRVLLEVLALGLPYAGWVLAILGAHELGHYAACRYHRIPATLPFFLPGIPPIGSFGAVIRIRGAIPDRAALFDVAAAGPIAGFLVALPALAWGLATAEAVPADQLAGDAMFLGEPLLVSVLERLFRPEAEHVMANPAFMAGWVGVLVTSLNLFPVGQLDGGHAAYALSRELHRILSYATLAGLVVLIAQQFLAGQIPSYLVWFGILLYMRARHPRLLDERVPLSPGRRLIAIVLAILFALCFIPAPFQVSTGG